MQSYSLTHVSDAVLLRDLASLVARDRMTTAMLLAHIAEVDHRRLYVPAGYASMHAYCVEELRLSEDAAFRRIRAARATRQFPVLFEALAEGRLHLAGVSLLAPHLTAENSDELIEASRHRRKSEIEEFLARRFGSAAPPAVVRAVVAPPSVLELVPGRVGDEAGLPEVVLGRDEASPEIESTAEELVPGRVDPSPSERFLVQVTFGRAAHDKLRRVQDLLSHAVPGGDLAQVLERALDALPVKLERQKLGAAARKGTPRTSDRKHHVPAHVRRAVWERDQGQCTFVNAAGKRCMARRLLEFDHIQPVARGGTGTVEGVRLRCRAHNQLEAERVFGAEFMARKRAEERTRREAETRAQADAREQDADLLAGLRSLGYRTHEARRAIEAVGCIPGASLEERLRATLQSIGRRLVHNRTADGAWQASPNG